MVDFKVGDVILARVNGRRRTIEVDHIDEFVVWGRAPYTSTYTAGGRYEGSYRGQTSCWINQVVEVLHSA